jgi:hypothetical protein
MRRRTVVRLSATLMFAGWYRMSGIRRKLPLTSFASARPRHSAAGDRSCNGGTPAHREGLGHPASQPGSRPNGKIIVQAAVISAHKNPASSRAMAAATTLLVFLRAAR